MGIRLPTDDSDTQQQVSLYLYKTVPNTKKKVEPEKKWHSEKTCPKCPSITSRYTPNWGGEGLQRNNPPMSIGNRA
jgi:hypothetical protein